MAPDGTHPAPGSEGGFTLVELLVAILVGVLLTLGTLQLVDAVRVTQRTEKLRVEVSQNGRFALDMVSRDLQQAGQGMDPSASFGVVAAGAGTGDKDTLYVLFVLPETGTHAVEDPGIGNAKKKVKLKITCSDPVDDFEAGDFVYLAGGSARGVAAVAGLTRNEIGADCASNPSANKGTVTLDVTPVDGEGHGWLLQGNVGGAVATEVQATAYFVDESEGLPRLARATTYEDDVWQHIPVADGVSGFEVELVFDSGTAAAVADGDDADPDNDYDDIDSVRATFTVTARHTDPALAGGGLYERTFSIQISPRNQIYSRNLAK